MPFVFFIALVGAVLAVIITITKEGLKGFSPNHCIYCGGFADRRDAVCRYCGKQNPTEGKT
jgi:hypothetical protein